MKLVTIIGARPQFIMAAAVSNALRATPGVEEKLVHTGQHFDGNMSQVFFDELDIPEPAYNLGIAGGSHGAQTGRMLEGIENVLLQERPDAVLVYGDTNSTLAGALAACKLHIPVAHVEAGLRSFNMRRPEEVNRIATDHVSDILFAPTMVASEHLAREGIAADKVHLVGDVMVDAALHFGRKADAGSTLLARLGLAPKAYILATVHRAENTDTPELLNAVIAALSQTARDVPVVLPLHPRTRKVLEARGGLVQMGANLRIIDPVGYLDMLALEKNAALVATDSGGVQKEAFFYGVPCVTLRDETEWVELVALGWNRLAPPKSGSAAISSAIREQLGTRGQDSQPYGDGRAAQKIVAALLQGQASAR